MTIERSYWHLLQRRFEPCTADMITLSQIIAPVLWWHIFHPSRMHYPKYWNISYVRLCYISIVYTVYNQFCNWCMLPARWDIYLYWMNSYGKISFTHINLFPFRYLIFFRCIILPLVLPTLIQFDQNSKRIFRSGGKTR